jgi:hypothetical protein
VYRGAGTDGADLGADIGMVIGHAARALAGDVTDSASDIPTEPPVRVPVTITTTSLAGGTVNVAYVAALAATGGTGEKRWALTSGALPEGLALDASGRIAGVPAAPGTFAFRVQVSDGAVPPVTAAQSLSLVIEPAVAIVTDAVPGGMVGIAYQATLSATGGRGGYTWSVVDATLPDGLALSTTGWITGTPTTPGTVVVTVQAADTLFPQNRATGSLSIEVTAPAFKISVPTPAVGIVGQPYQLAASAAGRIGTVTWSIVSGGLPPGVTLDASNGVMSGSPSAAGTFIAVVRGQDTGTVTRTDDALVTIVVSSKLKIATASLPSGNIGSPYNAVLAAAGSAGPVQWIIASGTLPDGLWLAASGHIGGAPISLGTSTFTVRAEDSTMRTNADAQSFTIVVTAREIVLYTPAARIVGAAWSRVDDVAAAAGSRVWNPDLSASRVKNALPSPSSYVELTFQAEAGVPYHLWLRSNAERDSTSNDSVYVQFSDSVDATGSAIYRIGTKQAAAITLEERNGAGVHGWGWQDNGEGNAPGAPIYFKTSGVQTLRLQQHEDGISVDQIVLSAVTYASTSPGAPKDDSVIVPR